MTFERDVVDDERCCEEMTRGLGLGHWHVSQLPPFIVLTEPGTAEPAYVIHLSLINDGSVSEDENRETTACRHLQPSASSSNSQGHLYVFEKPIETSVVNQTAAFACSSPTVGLPNIDEVCYDRVGVVREDTECSRAIGRETRV